MAALWNLHVQESKAAEVHLSPDDNCLRGQVNTAPPAGRAPAAAADVTQRTAPRLVWIGRSVLTKPEASSLSRRRPH